MKFKTIALLFITVIITSIASAQSGYGVYHDQINSAERCMFLNNNYDSARNYYDLTFATFDFCFLRDCVIAAELAMIYKDTASCLRYIDKGFENGLILHDLLILTYGPGVNRRVIIFDTLLSDTRLYSSLSDRCDSFHKKYLTRINKGVRKLINEAYIYDQIAKAYDDPKKMTTQYRFPYPEDKFAGLYDSLIATVGYPGERLIGIDGAGLTTSLGMPEEEPITIFQRYCDKDSSIRHIAKKDIHIYRDLRAHTSFTVYFRNSCSYSRFQDYMVSQVKAGNIHPTEVANLLRKEYFRYTRSKCQYDEDIIPYYFHSNSDSTYSRLKRASDLKRAKIYMISNDISWAALAFEKKYQIQLCFPH